MKSRSVRTIIFCLTVAVFLFHASTGAAAALTFDGRGVFHFKSESGCPPGDSTQTHAECNRIALDNVDAHATVDAASNIILFRTRAIDKEETVVGDVLLQGSGVSAEGIRVPLSLQLLLRHKQNEWNLDAYIHAPVSGKFTAVKIDPYQICVVEKIKTRVLFTADQVLSIFSHPTLSAQLARTLVAVKPSPSAKPSANDITIALGVGKLLKPVLRASFSSTAGQALTQGSWSIDLQALSNHIPVWAVQRELFLFGLEHRPELAGVRRDGFNENDQITFGARDGKGFLRFNGSEKPFDTAAAAGHAFMQESFMGLILGWRSQQAEQAVATSTPRLKKSQT